GCQIGRQLFLFDVNRDRRPGNPPCVHTHRGAMLAWRVSAHAVERTFQRGSVTLGRRGVGTSGFFFATIAVMGSQRPPCSWTAGVTRARVPRTAHDVHGPLPPPHASREAV